MITKRAVHYLRQCARIAHGGCGVYIAPSVPDWFVPSAAADAVLQQLRDGTPMPTVIADDCRRRDISALRSAFEIQQLLARFGGAPPAAYGGREAAVGDLPLRELWLHLTNRCNLSCRHCMFAGRGAIRDELAPAAAERLVAEAAALGCRLFYLTGGEPLVWPAWQRVCAAVLAQPDAHLVLLTNGVEAAQLLSVVSPKLRQRVHLQISIDGGSAEHNALRGAGAYERTIGVIDRLRDAGFNVVFAMTVAADTVAAMSDVVRCAARHRVSAVHYLWLFQSGRAGKRELASPEAIMHGLREAQLVARTCGVTIDNLRGMEAQVFSLPGTRFDLSNAGCDSLAVGPDGLAYPSPALVGVAELRCGDTAAGLAAVWRSSAVLNRLRATSLLDSPVSAQHPLRFLTGGGDIDHSWHATGELVGGDPYYEVYAAIAVDCIVAQARLAPDDTRLMLRARMGERIDVCGTDMAACNTTHSNCVLSLPGADGHALVRDFYAQAAQRVNDEIVNPVCYAEEYIRHIPPRFCFRGYGCGSPVQDCAPQPGETVVDLGSGTGIECLVAAPLVGARGRVVGCDMADPMLERARAGADAVAGVLGYRNVCFVKSLLEASPLADGCADAVISNCVLNLSPDKRQVLQEVFRILKPGGRMVISDIVHAQPVPLEIQYNEKLRGECIGGAFFEPELFGLLRDLGFSAARVLKRYLYREIQGCRFYSLTYRAVKPGPCVAQQQIYRGPAAGLLMDDGTLLMRGRLETQGVPRGIPDDDSVFVLDAAGAVVNVAQDESCCCSPAVQRTDGCMVCGGALAYTTEARQHTCALCGRVQESAVACVQGHYVCDACHARDALQVLCNFCATTGETDMLALCSAIRRHPRIPLHGPEHHGMTAAVVMTAYRNAGGSVSAASLRTVVERAAAVPGGACAWLGACGAALGVGAAFAALTGADPLQAAQRCNVMRVVATILERIAVFDAPRCCQRECLVALQEAARLSHRYLPLPLAAERLEPCRQFGRNRECIGDRCPFWDAGA